MADWTLNEICNQLCGYELLLDDTHLQSSFNTSYVIQGISEENIEVHTSGVWTLMPKSAKCATLITTAKNNQFLTWSACDDKFKHIYALKPEFHVQNMHDSILHVFCYIDRRDTVVIAIFDASKLCGEDISHKHIFERMSQVRSILSTQHHHAQISCHWSGYMSGCMEALRDGYTHLPFDSDAVVQLTEVLFDPQLDKVNCKLLQHCVK